MVAAADSLSGEAVSSVSLCYLPPSATARPTHSSSTDATGHTPNTPCPQSIPPPLTGTDSLHSNPPPGPSPHTTSHSAATPTGRVFVTVPTSSAPQSVNHDQPPPALIPIPVSQGSGTGTGQNDVGPAETLAPPTKRGRGRSRGRIGGRGRGGRTAQITSGDLGEGVVVRKRRGRGRVRLSLYDSASRNVTASVVAGVAGPSARVIAGGEGEDKGAWKKLQDDKRRALVMKAKSDLLLKKRSEVKRAILTQRKVAQRQRRERERSVMRQARERQDKINRQKEVEEREYRRQRMARQREIETERKAKERTHRLLAHLQQQEYDRDRRLYQHRLDLERAQQLKRPTEDLLVGDTVSFPPLGKLAWLKLPSTTFADLLMVFQFTHSFREFLEMEAAPSLPSLFCSLHNHGTEVLTDLFVQLLRATLFDPGSNALTTAGQPVTEVVVTRSTASEVARLFLQERLKEGAMPHLSQVVETLTTQPLESLCPSQKVQVLAALVNEIMASPDLCREVDIRMEQIASFRREKWKINLKLKRFRSKLSSEYGIGPKKKPIVYCGRGRPPKKALMNVGTYGQVNPIELWEIFCFRQKGGNFRKQKKF
jgi:hypothetical protein